MKVHGHGGPRALAAGSGGSVLVECCQVCGSERLAPVLFLGYMPPVNAMHAIGARPAEQPAYPAEVLRCLDCELVQLGVTVDPRVLFPVSYPYTSSTTKILRDNFAQLRRECDELLDLAAEDLVVDIGSNDGNLLSNFVGDYRVLGVTPEDIGQLAVERGIPTRFSYFDRAAVDAILADHGRARMVTATNVFAHIEDINAVTELVSELVTDDGYFVSESHYLLSLVETVQYDTVYHEHLRYYSLHSLKYLLECNGLEVFHAKRIPTHGGSIRVYAGRPGRRAVSDAVAAILREEAQTILRQETLDSFRHRVVSSKLGLVALLSQIKARGETVYGVGAPSRASTLVNYVGIDEQMVDRVLEVAGSYKIGKYVPGTVIPVVGEEVLATAPPEYLLLFSWHIADELMPKLKQKGYAGDFIVPLPEPRIVAGSVVP